ncbi:MAG: IS630 family transposase, partial [Pseudomonadota bacterium]
FFQRHGLTFKKTAHAEEQERPDVRARRLAWFMGQPDLDPVRLVFIDETGASTKIARTRGRSPRGKRCRSAIPHGHWKTTTFVSALLLDRMSMPMVLDGPMHRDAFFAYIDQVLVPTLRPGAVVIMDNLPAHKGARIHDAIGKGSARLRFLPPYSPDFNLIEMAFSKLKAFLKEHAPRTINDLWSRVGKAIDLFTPQECANYFAAAGYEPD